VWIYRWCEIIFFVWGKTHNGAFLGIFRGGLDLFDPQNFPRYAQDNVEVKKVSAPSKSPSKCPMMCFACEKKNSRTFRITGTLIVSVLDEEDRDC
jgi:hypothetical protein